MTRCEWREGRVQEGKRCPAEAVWLCRRARWCDDHARIVWARHPNLLDPPRDRGTCVVGQPPDFAGHGQPTDWKVPAWLPDDIRAAADRLQARVVAPASLFDEVAS